MIGLVSIITTEKYVCKNDRIYQQAILPPIFFLIKFNSNWKITVSFFLGYYILAEKENLFLAFPVKTVLTTPLNNDHL